ncbi:MAG: hypothetical protein Kow0099_04240 [Candidatus Abyssubacteria bacterium]
MPKLRFTGERYQGDGLTARHGDIIEVSNNKAAQLLRDFPDDWEIADMRGGGPEKMARSPKNKSKRPDKNKGRAPEQLTIDFEN